MNPIILRARHKINSLLHKELRHDRGIRYRARILLALGYGFNLIFTIILLSILFTSVNIESKWILAFVWMFQLIGCGLVVYFIQVVGSFRLAVISMMLTMMAVTFSGIVITGGPVISKVTYYVLFLPIIAFYLVGISKGFLWTILSFISLSILFFMSYKGFEFYNIFAIDFNKYFSFFIFILGFICIFFIILIYENTYLNLQDQHEKSHLQIEYLASHDQLTGVANRSFFYQEFDANILKYSDIYSTSQLVLLYISVIELKEINEQYGREAGDSVLRKVAKTLENGIRGTDLVARHGGDEFVILLKNVKDDLSLISIANKLSAMIKEPVDIVGTKLQVFPSIGIAIFPKHAQDARTLEYYAEEAMNQAKARKRDWKIYEGEISTEGRIC